VAEKGSHSRYAQLCTKRAILYVQQYVRNQITSFRRLAWDDFHWNWPPILCGSACFGDIGDTLYVMRISETDMRKVMKAAIFVAYSQRTLFCHVVSAIIRAN